MSDDGTRLAYVSTPGQPSVPALVTTVSEAEAVADEAQRDKPIRTPRTVKRQPRFTAGKAALRHVKVRPDVWRRALRLAKGDAYLLVVRDAETVTVANSREHAAALAKVDVA